MAASVLRGLVEQALADLLAFFQINVAGNGNHTALAVVPSNRSVPGDSSCQGDKDDGQEHPGGRSCSSGGGEGDGGEKGRCCPDSASAQIEVEQAGELRPQEKEGCVAGPPVFKVMFVVVK